MVDLKLIDEKTNLAGTNRMEILLFRLSDEKHTSKPEIYGINVFKVRELVAVPKLIKVPLGHECISGAANIRGKAIPVINLHKYLGCTDTTEPGVLIITEFNSSMQGFLVHEIENILRLDWNAISEPPETKSSDESNNRGGLLTAVSVLENGEILQILDVEKIIADILTSSTRSIEDTKFTNDNVGRTIWYADDSQVARAQVGLMLKKMGIAQKSFKTGKELHDALVDLARSADENGTKASDTVDAIITDIEMPVMDGYVLTRKLKADERLKDIPIMMHSSLSATENKRLGMKVGVDAYLPKLKPKEFAETITRILGDDPELQREAS